MLNVREQLIQYSSPLAGLGELSPIFIACFVVIFGVVLHGSSPAFLTYPVDWIMLVTGSLDSFATVYVSLDVLQSVAG